VEEWYSAGTRVSIAFAEHAKLLGEAGYDREAKSNGAPKLWLAKFTGALAITAAKGFWARPELRLFCTWATWSEAAGRAGVDSGQIYKEKYPNHLSGLVAGVQAEAIF
jgi:maltoporin